MSYIIDHMLKLTYLNGIKVDREDDLQDSQTISANDQTLSQVQLEHNIDYKRQKESLAEGTIDPDRTMNMVDSPALLNYAPHPAP